jgi:serine/threonine protein kinase
MQSFHSITSLQVSMLRGLFHENIVRYLGAQREGPPGSDGAESASAQAQTLSVFLEYVPGGSIRQLVARFGRLEEPVIRAYTRQLLLGLEYLHRSGIAHRCAGESR